MKNIILIFAILLFLGCPSNKEPDHGFRYVEEQDEDTTGEATSSDTSVNSDSDDSSEDSDDDSAQEDSETDDTNADDSGQEEPADSLFSYEDCSNNLPALPWEEPAHLSKPCNFRLLDQNGNEVELYDFEGDVILIDFSTMWCAVCRIVAGHAQGLHDQYGNFTMLTVLIEDTSGNPPTVDNLQEWADAYGITTAPVLAGSNDNIGSDIEQWSVVAWPTFFLIDKDFYLRRFTYWNEEIVTGYVEGLLAE